MKKVLTLLLVFTTILALSACKPDAVENTDAADAADAKLKLSLDVSDPLSVTSNVTLEPAGLHGSTITWSSSNTAVISNAGVVTRPAVGEDDVVVVLTATIVVGDVTETKEFSLKVIAAVPLLAMDIETFIGSTVADGDVVELTGVIVGTIVGKGFQMADDTGFVYVYLGDDNASYTYALGDNVTVTGEKDEFMSQRELVKITNLVVNSSDNALPAFVAKSLFDINAEDPEGSNIFANMYTTEGYVGLEGTKNNVYLYWYDTELNLFKVEVYYKSGDTTKVADIAALAGKRVEVSAVLYDWYSTGFWRLSTNTNSTVTEGAALTEQEQANLAAAFINLGDVEYVTGDIDLLTTSDITGASVAWASSDETVVSTIGEVTSPEGADATVTVTATVTVGAATATKAFTLTVIDALTLTPLTVTEALAETNGENLLVTGIVSGVYLTWGDNEVVLQDPVTGASIYVDWNNEAVVVGDEIMVRGLLELYTSNDNNRRQLDDGSLIEIISNDNPITVDAETDVAVIADAFALMNTYTTTLTVKSYDSYGYVFFEGSATYDLTFDTATYGPYMEYIYPATTELLATFTVMDLNYGNTRVVNVTLPTPTDAQLVAAAVAAVEMPMYAAADITLPSEIFGVGIVWTSANSAITDAGVVTQPAIDAANGTGDLTAVFTLNDATVTEAYTVIVPALVTPGSPDLFISEYIEGGSYNKAIEIYNPTSGDVDLSLYSLNYYSAGADDATNSMTLSGTLAAGEVYVLVYLSGDNAAVQGMQDVADYVGSFPTHNGDDCYELLKYGVVIDSLGTWGDVDWGKDKTLVRNTDITLGNTTYTLAEWTVLLKDDYTDLGSHTTD